MYTGKSQEQRAKAKMDARRKAYNKEMRIKRIASFIIDTMVNTVTCSAYVAVLGLLAYIAIAF